MFRRITRGSNEKSTENRVDPTDHLKIILTMATVPLPSRRPNEAERVDGEEDCAEHNQSNLEEFFARDVVHRNLLSVNIPGSGCKLTKIGSPVGADGQLRMVRNSHQSVA